MAQTAPARPSVEQTLKAVEDFFAPAVLHRENNDYITKRLAAPRAADDELRKEYLTRAADLLLSLHTAMKFEQRSERSTHSYDSTLLLGLYKLLDFLVLEGLYPSIPSGVGNLRERRAKSLFYTKHDPMYQPLQGNNVLDVIIDTTLDQLLKDHDLGLEPLVRHRVLPDLIAAYASSSHQFGRTAFPRNFTAYLEKYVFKSSQDITHDTIIGSQLQLFSQPSLLCCR